MFYKPPKYLINIVLLSDQAQILIISGQYWVYISSTQHNRHWHFLGIWVTLKMDLPLKVKLKVILLTLLNTHMNNNIRSELIQIFKHYCWKKQFIRMPQNMHDWLMKQPPHQVRNMLLHPPKVSEVKVISTKGQKTAPKQVAKMCNTKKEAAA